MNLPETLPGFPNESNFPSGDKIQKDLIHQLPIRSRIPRSGDQVLIFNASIDDSRVIVSGVVVSIRNPGYGAILQINANVPADFRGGPVIDSTGSLLGVATAKVLPEPQLVLAVAAASIQQLLISRHGMKLGVWVRAVSETRSIVEVGANVETIDEKELMTGLNYLWLLGPPFPNSTIPRRPPSALRGHRHSPSRTLS